jgi:ribose transport system substrate-binding protein
MRSCSSCVRPTASSCVMARQTRARVVGAETAWIKDLKGFYGANEGSAIGVIKGVQESGAKGITIVGFDSGKAQIDAIKDGTMAGAITQNPVGMGKELVDAATKAIKGEDLPKVIDTGFYWYDKSNIDDPKIKAVLYE